MRFTMLVLAVCAGTLFGCSGDGGEGSTLDVGGELSTDVPAMEIRAYEERPEEFCKGQVRRELFSQYDWQCDQVMGHGKCVVISENPDPDNSTFYCSLCGLKGEQMVCYMIQQDD